MAAQRRTWGGRSLLCPCQVVNIWEEGTDRQRDAGSERDDERGSPADMSGASRCQTGAWHPRPALALLAQGVLREMGR